MIVVFYLIAVSLIVDLLWFGIGLWFGFIVALLGLTASLFCLFVLFCGVVGYFEF